MASTFTKFQQIVCIYTYNFANFILILVFACSKLGCVHTGVLKSMKLPCFEMCNHTMLCVWHVYVNAAYKCCMKNILFSPISVYYFHSLWWSFSFRNIVFRETKVLQAAVVSCVLAANFSDINSTKNFIFGPTFKRYSHERTVRPNYQREWKWMYLPWLHWTLKHQ